MPLYEMTCYECEKVYEVQRPLSKFDEEVKCPHCGKPLSLHVCPVRFKIGR
jgi:putative FmdB family regulatory protein